MRCHGFVSSWYGEWTEAAEALWVGGLRYGSNELHHLVAVENRLELWLIECGFSWRSHG